MPSKLDRTYSPISPYKQQSKRIDKLRKILTDAGVKEEALEMYISLIIDYEPILEGPVVNDNPKVVLGDNRLQNFYDLIDTGLLKKLSQLGVKNYHLAELTYFLIQYAQPGSIKAFVKNDILGDLGDMGLGKRDVPKALSKITLFALRYNTPEQILEAKELQHFISQEELHAAIKDCLDYRMTYGLRLLHEKASNAHDAEFTGRTIEEIKQLAELELVSTHEPCPVAATRERHIAVAV